MLNFIQEKLHIGDYIIYIHSVRTGSSTVRKCKFVGVISGFTDKKVRIKQLSKPDQFVMPIDLKHYEEVYAFPEDIICKLKLRKGCAFL